jgi:RNA polymerase sigma factor (sigma-70 family)
MIGGIKMTKIILSLDEISKEIISREMTFEEVRKEFYPMLVKEMTHTNNKFIYNSIEKDDYMQELEIELWRAYKDYNSSTGNCFSTYLHFKLRKGTRNATYHKYYKKNQNNGISSLDAPLNNEEDFTLGNLIEAPEENPINNILYSELWEIVSKNVTDNEKETLYCMLNKDTFSVQDFADAHGITRQAANQKITKLRKKLQAVIQREQAI